MDSDLAIFGGSPAVDLPHPASWPIVADSTRQRIEHLLRTGALYDYAHGSVLSELEEIIGSYHGMDHILVTSSGTAALHSAFVGIGLEPGDEVLVTSQTFHATVSPLFLCSAVPVLVDCDVDTGNLNVQSVRNRITCRTKAIVVTHLWGHPAEMTDLLSLAERHELKIVEDCSHAHGATYCGRVVGSLGHVGIFSMGGAKMVSGGMGGALITDDAEIYDRAQLLGHCHERAALTLITGSYRKSASVGWGANYRIGTLAAAMCADQFRSLDERIRVKTDLLNGLSDRIAGIRGLRPPITRDHVTRGAWYGYKAVYHEEELSGLSLDRFLEALREEGLHVGRPSGKPLHYYESFQTTAEDPPFYRPGRERPVYRFGDFPNAERFYQQSISFPATRFNRACGRLLDQYEQGIRKVVKQHERLL